MNDPSSFAALLTPENLAAFLTLTALEIVLGIDNIVFIAIISARLPAEQQRAARRSGLLAAMLMRIALLLSLGWVSQLTETAITLSALGWTKAFSWRDIVLLIGGLVLLVKATREVHHSVERSEAHGDPAQRRTTFASAIAQIMVMDIVFSLDSVITAGGMSDSVTIMVAAVVASVAAMVIFADSISRFVHRHPSIKVLALSFLVLIGAMLVAEGWGAHVSKGYIYFAMSFSLLVEMLNLRARSKARRPSPPTAP